MHAIAEQTASCTSQLAPLGIVCFLLTENHKIVPKMLYKCFSVASNLLIHRIKKNIDFKQGLRARTHGWFLVVSTTPAGARPTCRLDWTGQDHREINVYFRRQEGGEREERKRRGRKLNCGIGTY